MAVSTTNAVSGPYVANGSTTAFPFTFKCLTVEEVRVTITVASVETEESSSSYSVTLNTGGNGGTVTFDVAPATGDIRIYSEPEFTQETGFASGQAFSPSVVNEALDRATVRDQYILRKINALLDEFDAGIVGDVRSDLGSTASASVGAGMVGFDDANSYAAGTAGYELRKLNTRNLGTIAGGGNTVVGIDIDTTVTANADGLSDFRGIVNKTVVAGANSMAEVDGFTGQLEIQTTGGTLTHGFAIKAYSRLGNAALGIAETGTITAFDVINGHIANEGNDAIGTAIVFRADSLDLIDGTGTITDAYGVGIGNFGHATRVTGNAVGVAVNDMTAGASKTIAFWSQMVDGTNKWSFYANSSAPSALGGRLAVGSTTRPTDTLDINGHIKAIRGASAKLATGSYHELRSDQNTWSTVVSNAHASTPNGLRIFFDGSSPNNTTQMFIECRDATEQKLMVWSNGNVVNKNNSYGAISDKKFKTGIRDATPQLDDIKAVRFRKYKLKSDGKNATEHLGVIAQEIEKVSPGLVSVDGNGTKSVNYSILYLKAVKALQELAAIVEAQDKRIKAMESRP